MKQRLLLIIALAVLASVTVVGVVSAAPNVLGQGQAGVEINLPAGGTLPDLPGSAIACANGQDDDSDDLVDANDPGCSGPTDKDERDPAQPGGGTTPDTGYEQSGGGGNGTGGRGKKPEEGKRGKDNGSGGNGPVPDAPVRTPDGRPTKANPGLSVAGFGPTPVQGVPNFMINQFEIPPFMLPIYQACGTQYGVPWPVLASIHKIESAFGTNMGPSTAGAIGQMQFLPSSWKAYGVDANNDGRKDPYNPLDAVCAAGRYLKAAGAEEDLRTAIFAYNHADWYVDEVLLVARQYGRLPEDLVGSLTGLTEGAHFPVAARATYADDLSERDVLKHAKPSQRSKLGGVTAQTVSSSPTRRGINIYSRPGAPVVAVNDGVIKEIGRSEELGRYVVLQDAYGNRFTYAQLGQVSRVHPVPKQHDLSSEDFELVSPGGKSPDGPASDRGTAAKRSSERGEGGPVNSEDLRPRLFAYPERPRNVDVQHVAGSGATVA